MPRVKGFHLNEGVKERYPLKRRYFATVGSYSMKTTTDSYRHVAYSKALVTAF